MARHSIAATLRTLWILSRKRPQNAGFTLTELLVAMIVGALITVGLLSLVVDLTDANQKDGARSEVQRDMQSAVDYMAQDLREAVFVYNGECLKGNGIPSGPADIGSKCPGIAPHMPASLTADQRKPVLAFWRTDPLPSGIATLCGTNAGNLATIQAIASSCIAGTSYSLVVYAIDTTPSDIWKGEARLVRYKLSQFAADASTAAQTTGYVDPLQDASYTFQQWPYRASGAGVVNRQTDPAEGKGRPTDATTPGQVLVDFVDDSKINNAEKASQPACADFLTPTSDAANPAEVSPMVETVTPRGFYACVRGGGFGTGTKIGENQEVLLILTGNVAGKAGFPKQSNNQDAGDRDRLTSVQTRVLVRGVVNKKTK